MTEQANARTQTQTEYIASKAAYLADARAGRITAAPTFTDDERKALIARDLAAHAAAQAVVTSTSSTATPSAPVTRDNARDARSMTPAQYAVTKAAYLGKR